jgi:tetratricopeptide (TPR) repeat protein
LFEVIIIVCLGLALFLLMRHYPEAVSAEKSEKSSYFGRVKGMLPKFKFGKKDDLEQIKKILDDGKDKIVTPAEIEEASKTYGELDPDIATLLHKSDEAFAINDLREAENLALEAIGKNKRCGQAYVIIGKIAYSRGQFEDAKEAFKTALKCDKELGEAYYGLGRSEYREENFTAALDHLQKAILFEKGYAEWYADLGRTYMEVRQYAKAAKVLRRATSLDIDNKEYKELAAEAEEKQRTHAIYSRR